MSAQANVRQAGFIAVEVLFGLIVLSILAGIGINQLMNRMDSQNYQIAADQQKQVADAAAKYLKDNFATVYAAAGSTTPAQITPAMLRNTNYLPAGFIDTNAFGQTFVVLARRVGTNQLESIVLTIGGQTIDEMGTREIAENLGAPGGFVPVANTGIVQGVRGGWSLTLSNYGVNPGAGHTASALFLQDGTLANDYLYRNAIAGKPELNRMNTALNMGGNDLNNAANITASGTASISGDVNAGRNVNASGNVNLNGTVTAGGDLRAGSMYLQGNASMNGNATVGGSVAVTGDVTTGSMYARGNVQGVTASMSGETYTTGWFRTRGDTGWYSEKWGGGWHMTDSDWIRAYAGKNVYTPGQMRGNSLFSEGRTYVGEYLQLNGTANENYGCNPNGLVSRDGAGKLLSCQNGLWKPMASDVSGTICGMATNYCGWDGNIRCQGMDPYCGVCPSGYYLVHWLVEEGDKNRYVCAKS
ncbi:shufflon system plasmid conjugative transfer pilus tip adhesin PilV [Pseudomonas oryzihabitans]|uniref:shufflon system plasmid conjugative transfer pilus tip adhesin PilV n=1 Tax=Pseudomonas oryzihabitans TaxID=47885 RepID=UPI00214E3EEA|nr:shufflon system plasmid conjugative transfer pilus tip adhesin PilV [Pseudomonas psychrotolerans]UUW72391.1 shufflon system plasmid conjugative transfer pilus tip adhesin PilV [Pseudomonas psychrotolerans]